MVSDASCWELGRRSLELHVAVHGLSPNEFYLTWLGSQSDKHWFDVWRRVARRCKILISGLRLSCGKGLEEQRIRYWTEIELAMASRHVDFSAASKVFTCSTVS